MKNLYKALAAVIAVFFIIVFITSTVSFIRKAWFGSGQISEDHVVVLDIEGIILTPEKEIKDLEEIVEHPGTKALVIRVNSPGGLVAPSQEIYRAIKKTDKKIPVVISMGPLAASGGYYLSLGARKIIASPGTLTASIGVIVEFINTQGLYKWAKVERYSITTGKFKDTGSPFRPMKPEERKFITDLVNDIQVQFRNTVKERRGLNDKQLENVADGRVMTGSQALKAKLIDSTGGFQEALKEARTLAGLEVDAPVRYIEPDVGALRKFLLGDAAEYVPGHFFKNFVRQLPGAFISPGWQVLLLSPVR